MRRGTLLGTAALATGLLTATTTPADAGAATAVGPSMTLVGNGFGHGRGMSQWGAYGRAKAGQTRQQILAFYYPGATLTTTSGSIRVLVGADTTRDVVVRPAPGLTVRAGNAAYAVNRPGATAYRLKPVAGRTAVQARTGGRWRAVRRVAGTAEWSASGDRLSLVLPGGATRSYRGRLRSVAGRTVNVVPLDSYLKGVVPAEMPSSWSPQALQAQADAARTYAWSAMVRNAGRTYDICDSTACQVYGGAAAERATSSAAVDATAGEVLAYRGAPAFTEFSASNGGTTAGWMGTAPQADPYDTAYRGWTVTANPATLGRPTTIALTNDASGRVVSARLTFANGSSRTVSGDAIRSAYGLRSTLFGLG